MTLFRINFDSSRLPRIDPRVGIPWFFCRALGEWGSHGFQPGPGAVVVDGDAGGSCGWWSTASSYGPGMVAMGYQVSITYEIHINPMVKT